MVRRGSRLLSELDPELLEAVPVAERPLARGLRVPTLELSPGTWRPPTAANGALLGLLIADGVAFKSATAAGFTAGVLLGHGDVVAPSVPARELPAGVGAEIAWHVVDPLTVAVLDARFAASTARWPLLAWRVLSRQAQEAERLLARLALVHRQRVDERVLLVLWELADRWGKVTSDGVLIPIQLRHHQLAALVGSLRPSVTLALRRLASRGIVERSLRGYLLRATIEEAWPRLDADRQGAASG
jgi:hypothetical protein